MSQTLGPAPVALFPGSAFMIADPPEESGFFHLEAGGHRWMAARARCRLTRHANDHWRRPCLIVTSQAPFDWHPHLSLAINGEAAGGQIIHEYNDYYFPFDARLIDCGRDTIEIDFRAHRDVGIEGGARRVALPLYALRLIDLAAPPSDWEERRLFVEQAAPLFSGDPAYRALFETLPSGPEMRILDVGAGTGWSTLLLALRTGARVWGVDLRRFDDPRARNFKTDLLERFARHLPALQALGATAPSTLDEAALAAALERCSFTWQDAMELWFQDGMFDAAYSLNAFEHIARPDRALAEIQRVLRPDGQAFILFHLPYHCDGGHHLYACNVLDKPWVTLQHTREEIRAMVAAAGGPVHRVDEILDTLNQWPTARFKALFAGSDMRLEHQTVHTGFTIPGADRSDDFKRLQRQFPVEELTTTGMCVRLRKAAQSRRPRFGLSSWRKRNAPRD